MTERTDPRATLDQRQTQRLTVNANALTEVKRLNGERAKLVEAISKAPMFDKARLVTEAVEFSLQIEQKLTTCIANLTALAADEVNAVGMNGLDPEPETEAEDVPGADQEETDQEETDHGQDG